MGGVLSWRGPPDGQPLTHDHVGEVVRPDRPPGRFELGGHVGFGDRQAHRVGDALDPSGPW